jgi:hypothetical protein
MPNTGNAGPRIRGSHDGVVAGLGVARAVGQEHAVGLQRQHVGRRRCAGTTVSRQPRVGEHAQDVALHAVVVGDDVETRLAEQA